MLQQKEESCKQSITVPRTTGNVLRRRLVIEQADRAYPLGKPQAAFTGWKTCQAVSGSSLRTLVKLASPSDSRMSETACLAKEQAGTRQQRHMHRVVAGQGARGYSADVLRAPAQCIFFRGSA